MNTMYPAVAGSPVTTLSAGISETDTVIPLNAPTALPPAPNLATIYDNNNFETVVYTSKDSSSITVNNRALEGVARSWGEGTKVSRLMTAEDHNTIKNNLENLAGDEIGLDDANLSFTASELQTAIELLNQAGNISFDDTNFFASAGDVSTALLALSSAGIVEHNFDVSSPSNGYYVRWENGLQVCFKSSLELTRDSNNYLNGNWTFPASFSDVLSVVALHENKNMGDTYTPNDDEILTTSIRDISNTNASISLFRVNGKTDFQSEDTAIIAPLSIGRWK